MIKYILVGILFICWSIGLSQSNAVQKQIDLFSNSTYFESASISFEAVDLATGHVIASYNPKLAMAPASTVKLFTTATAFLTLGGGYQPETRFYLDGYVDTLGVLQGNLFIRGGGDPSLGSRFFEKRETVSNFLTDWAKSLIELGIKKINGAVIADGSDFGYNGAPGGWTWADLGNYYGAGPAGCTLYDNMVYLLFNTGDKVGDSTHLSCTVPYIPNFELDNYVVSAQSKRDNSYVYGAPYLHSRFITGSLPAKEEEFEVKASIPDPEYLLALELDYALQQQGVSIAQAPEGYRTFKRRRATEDRYDKQPFYSYKGKTLSSVAYHTNMRSVNLFAEQLLCLIPYEKYGVGTTYKGSEFVTRFWEDKMKAGYRITDGSGLSRNNALSANHFTAMLSYMSASRFATDFENTLPVAGKSGTLSRVCRGQVAQGRLYAKSGTMSRIKSYAGYVKSSSGKKIAFAIIVNNYLGSSSNVVRKMEKVFNAMATY